MADLQTQTFDQLVEVQANAVQGASTGSLIDFSVGSILRALAQAFAAVVLWLQAIILQLLTTTRAATSQGADLDTWMADFSVTRLAAVAATGQVTFARFTPTNAATIPVGALIQTADGTVQYAVVADTSLAAWSASAGAYVIPASTTSAIVAVQAVTAGAIGNAAAGAVNTLAQAISGVDTVSNALAFANGADGESDAAFRLRFVEYIGSLAKATPAAVDYAITSLQLNLTDKIVENYDYAGNYKPGTFYTVIDDGSGSPSADTVNAAASAVEAVRACGIQQAAFAVVPVVANVGLTVGIAAGYVGATVRAAVQSAIAAYIASLTQGETLMWGRLYSVAYGVAGVSSVTGLTINSGTDDLTATAKQVVQAGAITVT
ncbi:putative phage protein gp47/JayE [Novosphingobium capsulatum]|uniref:Phage protein gp47/JayE n=1 Tax=Novosphingobium capsulatum TaxID=13688 RepID=A0ABU1MM95_9SPHN|nr:baseplate J/gp47 family protein [Novosphingobium capsulatum]MDR6511448.1 putative phage protein gp47/JayE [Novosphingobium capsulatum]